MGVLDQSFDVLVLRYGVQKRIYCKVRLVRSQPNFLITIHTESRQSRFD